MNIQRLSESLYYIWHYRMKSQLLLSRIATDYVAPEVHSKVIYHTDRVERELSSVHFDAATNDKFEEAVNRMKVKIPYIKNISRIGLTVHPIVGNTEELERRRAKASADINSSEVKSTFIRTANEVFRNAFQ